MFQGLEPVYTQLKFSLFFSKISKMIKQENALTPTPYNKYPTLKPDNSLLRFGSKQKGQIMSIQTGTNSAPVFADSLFNIYYEGHLVLFNFYQ